MRRRRKGEKRRPHRPQPTYPLSRVRELIENDAEIGVLVQQNAQEDARRDFDWRREDVLAAVKSLRRKYFIKTGPLKSKPFLLVDVYIAPRLKGESIYTHFYVNENGHLVINSFKRLRNRP